MKSEFISKAGFIEMLAITPGTLEGWIKRHWDNGNQYVVIGHTILIHIERANQWIKSHGRLASDPVATESEFASGDTARSFTRKRSQVTRTARVISRARSSAAAG